MKLGIVIPSYNEEENVEKLAEKILDVMKHYDFQIIFINDGSLDRTGEILDKLAEDHKEIVVIHHKINKGYAGAIKTGFDHCISEGLDTTLIMDSDLTHDPKDIPRFTEAFEKGADLVIGSRYLPGGGMINVPPRRVLISSLANFSFRLLLGLNVRDISSGFRGYRTEMLKKIPILSDSFQIHVELTTKAIRSGYVVVEIPITLYNRRLGVSNFKLQKVLIKYIKLVFRLMFQRAEITQ